MVHCQAFTRIREYNKIKHVNDEAQIKIEMIAFLSVIEA